MSPIPDFTEAEQRIVQMLLRRRYATGVAIEQADSELLLDPTHHDMTICPAIL